MPKLSTSKNYKLMVFKMVLDVEYNIDYFETNDNRFGKDANFIKNFKLIKWFLRYDFFIEKVGVPYPRYHIRNFTLCLYNVTL